MRSPRGVGRFFWSVPVGFQLSAIYALLLAVVLSLLGTIIYSQVNTILIQNTAERLNRTTNPIVIQPTGGGRGYFSGRPPDSGFGFDRRGVLNTEQVASVLVQGLSASDVAIAVLDDDGAVITSTTSIFTGQSAYIPPLPSGWRNQASSETPPQWVLPTPSGGRNLVMVSPVTVVIDPRVPGLQLYLEQVASLEAADAVLNQLRLYVLVGILVGTILGVVAGLALTRVVLRPLDRMARTAAAIEAGDLNRRLRLPPGRNEVARLGHAFDGMVERLASALEAQRRFVADASHELRTPLTSLEGLSEMILIGADRGDMSTVQRTLRSMHNELGRLSRLVTDLLTLSRLDSTDTPGHIDYSPFDVCGMLLEIAEQVAPMAEAQGVHLSAQCPGPAIVRGDADKLKQVLLNLVDNALRYTPAGGEVSVSAYADQILHEVRIQVQDTGPGIPQQDLPHVFDRFYRGDPSRARATGNSGLGLAIARSIVQMHGGTITAQSTPGQGARFIVALPAAAKQAYQPQQPVPMGR